NPGTINNDQTDFCLGGTRPIGGTNSPYVLASGGVAPYNCLWQIDAGCTGNWVDIPGSASTSYTPVAPTTEGCYRYRRKVTDACGAIAFTGHREFTIYPDLVSQNIVPIVSGAVCTGTDLSATFSGGGGGVPGIFNDVYEVSTNGGSTWSTYTPGNNISTTGLSGNNVVRVRTQRVSSGVDGCNQGDVITFSWTVNALPSVTAPAVVCVGSTITLSPTNGGTW